MPVKDVKVCQVTSGLRIGEGCQEVMERSPDESMPYHVLLGEAATHVLETNVECQGCQVGVVWVE